MTVKNEYIKEMLEKGFDLLSIRDALNDGEYLATTDMTQEDVEAADDEIESLIKEWDKKMRYTLLASNVQGAIVKFRGETIKSVINQFDNDYVRSGFVIEIIDNSTTQTRFIKSTYK